MTDDCWDQVSDPEPAGSKYQSEYKGGDQAATTLVEMSQ
jgi:hypothetical protein